MIHLLLEMRKLRSCYSILILHVVFHLVMVHAQDDQSGFISIDCGIPEGSNYTDKTTGIHYVSDAGFIEGGVNREILLENSFDKLDLQLTTLKSFPQNIRNCYTLRPKQGKNNRYLIRVRYYDRNYTVLPREFDLYLGADLWYKRSIRDPSWMYFDEIIHVATSDFVNICLVNTGHGIPFVSAIELRLLDINMYELQSTSLDLAIRYSFGSKEKVRYEDDEYDRIWYPFTWQLHGYRVVQTSETISSGPLKVPSKVMSTALTPNISTKAIFFIWYASSITNKYIVYLHFAEVEMLTINQTREFNVYVNGKHWFGPFSPSTKTTTTIETPFPLTDFSNYTLEINRTINSTLPPIINAIEVYILKQFQQRNTQDQDAAAIWSIKSTYGLKRNWQGDPCFPQAYVWDGLSCKDRYLEEVRIISLNLSSSGLSGEIAIALANLTMIELLDLSYNNLTGNVPEFLGRLDNLRILNLSGNSFTKPLPAALLDKAKKGSLTLSIEDTSSGGNKKVIIAVIATITPIVVLLTAFTIIWMIRRRKRKDLIIKDELFPPEIKS